MSLSLALADARISRIIGGSSDANITARCREALADAMEELQLRNDWSFLLTDTGETFTATNTTVGASTTITAASNGLKDVLVGMTVTGTNIAANTTVTAVASTTSITISPTSTGTAGPTVTFGGTIPLIAGTQSYTLPQRFWKPFDCRLTSSTKRPLRYMTHREFDLESWDQSVRGFVYAYTIYNPTNFDANGTQQTKIKFFQIPGASDVALLKYYRPFDITLDPVDIPDEYLNTLILLAQVRLMTIWNALDERIPIMTQKAEQRVRQMIAKDRNEGGEDEYESFHTPDEASGPWRGDPFYPRGTYGNY